MFFNNEDFLVLSLMNNKMEVISDNKMEVDLNESEGRNRKIY